MKKEGCETCGKEGKKTWGWRGGMAGVCVVGLDGDLLCRVG